MKSLNKQYFYHFHPLIVFFYFCSVLTIIMFSVNPIVRLITLMIGLYTQWRLEGVEQIKKDLQWLSLILLFSTLGNFLFIHTGRTILFEWTINASKSYRFTLEALFYGFSFGLMMFSIFIWFRLFSYSFNSEKILYLFGKRMPKISLVLSMILRFIPLYQAEVSNIRLAQKGLGVASDGESNKKMEKEYQTFLSLFGWSLERAVITSDSMNARGYGLKNRTQYQSYTFQRRDVFLTLSVGILLAGYYYCSVQDAFSFYYYPRLRLNSVEGTSIIGYVIIGCLMSLPLFIEVKERVRWIYLQWKM
ncbi:MAG: energy-coupling factor transporter transmembrane component T [Vagococcus sp.]|uniref:energy-coupling factor transporter transmembrane component T n=1 Tax=Vagococcus sp. TaxID=1933889 RepID=UPI002FCC467B